jgi:hypothetical protein
MKMRIFIIITGLLSAGLANAQQDYPRDITLSWINPSAYTDGTLIQSGDLTQIRLECYRHDDALTPVFSRTEIPSGEGTPQSVTYPGVIPRPGTYTCYGYAAVADGTESDPSLPAAQKYLGKPNPIVFQ